jgi:hypothetical protein
MKKLCGPPAMAAGKYYAARSEPQLENIRHDPD